jgi:EAL domain-containing protein (putative c-di-GMP-specific phosphodiesterase class I)
LIHHSTPSIGAALFNGAGQNAEELLKHADIAMYEAKAAGRNALRFFDQQMQANITARAQLENELRHAIADHQFEIYFQPQVSSPKRIIGAELLIRWQHPRRGLIAPNDFIPLAEETGLILALGQWVLEQACTQIKQWESSALTHDLKLAVNVSARQFRQADFVQQVCQTLQNSGIQANRLKLELTESMVMGDLNDAIVKMHALRTLGVCFSMDDFGTGYSSLSCLKKLPIDQLKIDRSFVSDIDINLDDTIIVQAIIAMANKMHIEVIAEGVETEQQKDFLFAQGCPNYQGFLFGKPMPLPAFERLIQIRA